MRVAARAIVKDLALVGAGHANVAELRRFASLLQAALPMPAPWAVSGWNRETLSGSLQAETGC